MPVFFIIHHLSFIIEAAGRINVHLTVGTIKLKTETATVAYLKIERLTPLRALTTMLYAIAHAVTQTVTALHQRSFPTLQLKGRRRLNAVEVTCLLVGYII